MHEQMIEVAKEIRATLEEIEEPNGYERSAIIHATVLGRLLGQAKADREVGDKLKAAADAPPPEQKANS